MIRLLTLLLLSQSLLTSANYLAGSLDLDILTFNKTLKAFPYSLVKFDNGFPNGVKHQVWGELAKELSEVSDINVAEVRIKDYGDNRNKELGERFGITKDQFPEIILFVRKQNKEKGVKYDETRYGGELSSEDLKVFLKHKTGVYLNLPGCLKKFDKMASWFMTAEAAKENRDAEMKKVLDKVEKDAEEEDLEEEDKVKARKYIKIMKLVAAQGGGIIGKEEERIKKMLKEDKMSGDKREELKKTLNMLKSFVKSEDKKKKDEL